MTVLTVTAATLTGLVGLPLALLWALRGVGRRLARAEDHHTVGDYLPASTPLLAAPQPLSDEDRIHQEEQAQLAAVLAADREYLARLGRIVDRRFAAIDNRARRRFGAAVWDEAAAWALIDTGEYDMVGTA